MKEGCFNCINVNKQCEYKDTKIVYHYYCDGFEIEPTYKCDMYKLFEENDDRPCKKEVA